MKKKVYEAVTSLPIPETSKRPEPSRFLYKIAKFCGTVCSACMQGAPDANFRNAICRNLFIACSKPSLHKQARDSSDGQTMAESTQLLA